jgi:hypothetical protein
MGQPGLVLKAARNLSSGYGIIILQPSLVMPMLSSYGLPGTRDIVSCYIFCGISNLTIMLAGLHDNLLSLFGTPIGEMFDLERLAETCKIHHRWSFFFTSAPLNFPGGIASPPNGICIL